MTIKIVKIGNDHFNHRDGSRSPVEKYELNWDGKTYYVHTGCKEAEFDWEISTYVWSSNGRYCEPSKNTHKQVAHHFWNFKACGLIEERI
jgi:hypothetical protein